ncbi:MAG: signal peptidase I [Clostridia bacterium]|nr:signal peptidase I [Clostridia bacterium]
MNGDETNRTAGDYGDDLEIEKVASEAELVAEEKMTAAEEKMAAAEETITAGEEAALELSGQTVRLADDMVDTSRFLENDAVRGEGGKEVTRSHAEPERMDIGTGKKTKGKKNVGKEILSWILTFVIAFLVAIIINAYFFRISKVSGNSMLQTFNDGQTVFISRAPYIFSEPKFGDIVVFDHDQVHRNLFVEIKESIQYNIITMSITKNNYSHKYWIKRVIGVPGDVIEIKEEGVYRNGVLLSEEYVNPAEIPNYIGRGAGKKWVVGEGQLFVMGDNRNHSSDSRAIGLITINSVLGKVLGQ